MAERVVWVEPLVANDIGYSGRALLLQSRDTHADVLCLDGTWQGDALTVPVDGVLEMPD
jgi:hypothetical protein